MSEERKPINVKDFLMIFTNELSALAWSKLGLQPDPMTGEPAKDLDQAKVAIDVVADLVGIIEPELDETDKREIRNLVSNLRVNYVEKLKEQ